MTKKTILRLAALLLTLVLLASPVSANASQRLQVEREVYDFLVNELMLSTAAACGVLANIEHESAFQPTIYGDKGTSYGLCQWHNERFTALRSYSAALGLDYRTVEGQMAYLKFELGNNYTSLLLTLQGIDDTPEGAYRAAYLWCIQFERPSNAQVKAAARGELARGKYWNRYQSFEPIIIVRPVPEETEPNPEVLLEQLKQNPVTIPLPPAEESVSSRRYVAQKPELIFYTSFHLPMMLQAQPEGIRWEYPALAAIAVLMVLVWVFPENKKRRKVYSEGRFVIKSSVSNQKLR